MQEALQGHHYFLVKAKQTAYFQNLLALVDCLSRRRRQNRHFHRG
jgi:hypothetical protein